MSKIIKNESMTQKWKENQKQLLKATSLYSDYLQVVFLLLDGAMKNITLKWQAKPHLLFLKCKQTFCDIVAKWKKKKT